MHNNAVEGEGVIEVEVEVETDVCCHTAHCSSLLTAKTAWIPKLPNPHNCPKIPPHVM